MRIEQIKTSGDSVFIEYSEQGKDGERTVYTVDCKHRAAPDFYFKRNQLADHVVEMLELEDEYSKTMEVRNASFKYIEQENKALITGVVITVVKKLKSGKSFVINTPYATNLPMGNSTDFDNCLSEVCMQILLAWQEAARKYVGGERAQIELPLDEKNGKSKVHRLSKVQTN